MFFKEGVDSVSQDPLPLAVDNPDFKDPLLVTGQQVVIHHGRGILRPEGVQVDHTIYGKKKICHGVFNRSRVQPCLKPIFSNILTSPVQRA